MVKDSRFKREKALNFMLKCKKLFISGIYFCVNTILFEGEKYLCTKKYEAQLEDEISLDVGAIVQCFQKSSDGWWQVR